MQLLSNNRHSCKNGLAGKLGVTVRSSGRFFIYNLPGKDPRASDDPNSSWGWWFENVYLNAVLLLDPLKEVLKNKLGINDPNQDFAFDYDK